MAKCLPAWHPTATFDNSLNKLPPIVLNCGHGCRARQNKGHPLCLLPKWTVCPMTRAMQTRFNKELSSQNSLLNVETSTIAVDAVDTSQSSSWPFWWLEKSPLHSNQPCVKSHPGDESQSPEAQPALSSFTCTFDAAVTLQVGVLMRSEGRSIRESVHCVDFNRQSGTWCRVLQRNKAGIPVGHKPLSATLSELALTVIECPSAVERGWFRADRLHAVCFAASSPQSPTTVIFHPRSLSQQSSWWTRNPGTPDPARSPSQRHTVAFRHLKMPLTTHWLQMNRKIH